MRIVKKLLWVSIFVLFISFPLQPAEAGKRLLPRFRSSRKSAYAPRRSYSTVIVSPMLRRDRRALIVYFGNLHKASSVSYTLTYKTNGKTEGVGGVIKPSKGERTKRTLLFGTCSGGVCRYHRNITNMRFKVVSKLISGKTSIKRYRVRI